MTSLDVIHDFWAYQIGVKADANPGSDNVAFTTTRQLGVFTVRCDELCGLWHGAMYDYGKVVSKSPFDQWATTTETQARPAHRHTPGLCVHLHTGRQRCRRWVLPRYQQGPVQQRRDLRRNQAVRSVTVPLSTPDDWVHLHERRYTSD